MREAGQIDADTAEGLIEPEPPEVAHVLAVWRFVGGKLDWQNVLIGAELYPGDPELLVDGLMCIRDETRAWRDEKAKMK